MTFIPEIGDYLGPILFTFVAAAVLALALTPLVRRVVLRRIILSGLKDQTELPFIPAAEEPTEAALAATAGPARRRNPRRGG